MIFLSDKSHLEQALKGKSKVWVLPKAFAEHESLQPLKENALQLLVSSNPKLAMADIAKSYFRSEAHLQPVGTSKIHSSASIDETAEIGEDVTVGPFAVIGRNCKIGNGSFIGAHVVIEPGAQIGPQCRIHPQVFVGHDCILDEGCEIKPQAVIGGEGFGYATDPQKMEHHRITHFGRVRMGKRVHVGSGTTIDRGTFEDSVIADDVKIDNLCHFGHNIQIGKGSIITGGVVVAGSVKIGAACVLGGGTLIAGHLEIADQVHLGGFSGVTKSIEKSGAYGGYPIQPLKDYLRTQSSLPSLPQMRKSLAKLNDKIFGDS